MKSMHEREMPAKESWQPDHWYKVRIALLHAASDLATLNPRVEDTLHVGASDENPGNCQITLKVHSDRNLTDDEKSSVISRSRPIIEQCLTEQRYKPEQFATFKYAVMYANSDRNMSVVGKAIDAIETALSKLIVPVISTYHLGPFSGEPDDFTIYLCVDTKASPESPELSNLKQAARELLEAELLKCNYPEKDLKTFSYELVSKQCLDDAGGWWSYLR